ncbi:MAG: replication-relaxation family protein [Sphingomonadaceae bacterium]|jgi:hypothetical protein|nr:replication-relaxation family protein [Sphingomonadaceae bacterium]
MKPLQLSAADEQMLAALGQYRLLTMQQIERLGIANRKHAGERLKRLAAAGYVDSVRGSPMAPGVFWLTLKAAKHFADVFAPEWAQSASAKGFSGSAHLGQRVATVDVCIGLRAWAERTGYQVKTLRTDFDGGSADLKRATSLTWNGVTYTADALGELIDASGAPWVIALEVETGGHGERLDNFQAKLQHRLDVISGRHIDRAMNRPPGSRAARMLFVFKSAAMLGRALKSLPEPAAKHWQAIFFAALPDVVENFGGPWLQATGERRNPFQPVAS